MICKKWDVHNLNGKFLSIEFVVSDEKENVMHCTMKNNISHCFIDKIQEEPVVSVSKSAQPRTRSNTLDFALTNERVTLWGKLGDGLLKMMSGHCENYTLILTSMSAKYYNSQLGISSCSSILILDSDEIPAIKKFKPKISDVDETKPSLPISESKPHDGTIKELSIGPRQKKRCIAFSIYPSGLHHI
ncbi:hypothetical protein Tco_0188622 [Tanacetum coccineum]